jgi:4-amino-4-deoxy-L-arabinose transferase-like glycosyltransferase
LFAGRAMITLFSAATGLIVFLWSRRLFGLRGAFFSLVLFVFCPAFLAHGALATSDAVMAFFFLAATSAWWLHLERPGLRWTLVSALTLGLALVAKFSALLLGPIFALSAVGWLLQQRATMGWRRPLLRLARSTAVHVLIAWAVIWTFYGWRFSAFAPDAVAGSKFQHGWDWILGDMGWPRGVFLALRDGHVLPEAFLYGAAFVAQFARQRAAFLCGDYSVQGWVAFFPYTFLVKTTVAFLLLVALGIAAALRTGWRHALRRLQPLTPLLALFAVYWATSLASHLNIGHRHILPTYPVLYIVAGAFGRWLDFRRPFAMAGIVVLGGLHVVESAAARPNYLAFFNAAAGGTANGWRQLVDSSLDWGQDLPGLKAWLNRQAPGEHVHLAYFGTGDAAHEGIRATLLPALPEVGAERPWHALQPGIYAISATLLQQVYSPVRGPWTLDWEKEFQDLRAGETLLLAFQHDPVRRAALLAAAPEEKWRTAWRRYELLRFARLCHWLRVREAEAIIGGSILVYRVSASELQAAVAGSLADWQQLIERTAAAKSR